MLVDRRSLQVIVAMCLACAAIVAWSAALAPAERDCCVTQAAPEFPCADHGCGCATSEQCRNACCCYGKHTLASPKPEQPSIASFVARERTSARIAAEPEIVATAVLSPRDCSCGRTSKPLASPPGAVAVSSLAPEFEPADEPSACAVVPAARYSDRRPSPAAPPPRISVPFV